MTFLDHAELHTQSAGVASGTLIDAEGERKNRQLFSQAKSGMTSIANGDNSFYIRSGATLNPDQKNVVGAMGQLLLKWYGYTAGTGASSDVIGAVRQEIKSGRFGAATEKLLKQFQSSVRINRDTGQLEEAKNGNGLTPDGVFGVRTLAAMAKWVEKNSSEDGGILGVAQQFLSSFSFSGDKHKQFLELTGGYINEDDSPIGFNFGDSDLSSMPLNDVPTRIRVGGTILASKTDDARLNSFTDVVVQFFKKKGIQLNNAQIAAVVGTCLQENNLCSSDAGVNTGIGICQWMGDRRQNLIGFIRKHKLNGVAGNLEFMYHEMFGQPGDGFGGGSERHAGQLFLNARSLGAAMGALKAYERYGDPGNRYRFAEAIYAQLQRGG